jgi:hypothetical protein
VMDSTSYPTTRRASFASMTYPNSVIHSYSYDNRDRPTGLNLGALANYAAGLHSKRP